MTAGRRGGGPAFLLNGSGGGPSLGLVGSGLQVGVDQDGTPVRVHLFGERIAVASLVLDLPTVAVLLARVVDTGARVTVVSARPRLWEALGQALPGSAAVQVCAPYADLPDRAGFARPLLVLRDSYLVMTAGHLRPGPWRSSANLLRELGPVSAAALRGSRLVLLRRLPEPEAVSASRLLGLPRVAADVLAAVPDSAFAVLAQDRIQVVDPGYSAAEEAVRERVRAIVAADPDGGAAAPAPLIGPIPTGPIPTAPIPTAPIPTAPVPTGRPASR